VPRSGETMTLSLPPFTRAVTWLLAINTSVFLLMELLGLARMGPVVGFVFDHFELLPNSVIHGEIWQIVTYSFLHVGFWHWFGNMIGLWMFGSAFESAWGTRRFVELFFVGVVGAALTTIALSYTHVLGSPFIPTVGASGGVFAILIAFGMVFGENEIMLIPFPFLIKAKYFVAILIVVTLALAMAGGGNVAYVAHLGGLFFGYLYVKRGPRGGVNLGLAERYYALHNSYYRWKRRRAARKFEVYMRQHDRDVHFDEHGNYVPPDEEARKGNGGSKSGWVN
jgi:membrane associated rhomboid family serine protease